MFDILYGWRKWQQSRLQWLILASGFALFTALVSILLQLGLALIENKPVWVNNEQPAMTIGRENINGDLSTIAAKELNKLSQLPQVDQVGRIGIQAQGIQINDNLFKRQEVAYFNADLIAQLALPQPFEDNNSNLASKVFISHSFWIERLKQQSIETIDHITIVESGKSYQVAGIAPKSMDKIGHHKPQFWLADTELAAGMKIDLPNNNTSEAQKKAIKLSIAQSAVNDFPMFYGIATLRVSTSADDLLDALNGLKTSEQDSDMTAYIIEAEQPIKIVDGIEFNPKGKKVLNQHWWLLMLLTLGFGLLNALNLLTVSTSRLIERKSEFSIRISLGGSTSHTFKQLLLEQLPFQLFSIFAGLVVFILSQHYLAQLDVYKAYFGIEGFSANWALWLLASIFIFCFITFCACIPLISLLRQSFFTRSKAGEISMIQKWLSHLNAAFLIAIAISVLTMASNMLVDQWRLKNTNKLNQNLVEIAVSSESPILADESMFNGALGTFPQHQFALSNSTFVSPQGGLDRKSVV